MYKCFIFFALLSSQLLHAEAYRFSGGVNNMEQKIASKVLIKAYSQAGIEMQPIFISLQESLRRSNAGITDGELARIKKITRLYPNLRQVPVSVVSVEAVAFSKNRLIHIDKWDDLRGYRVAIVKGVKFIEAGTKDIPKELFLNITEAFERLNANETDIVVVPKLAGWAMIHKNKFKQIRMVSSSLQTMKLYHFVHKKNIHLISLVTPYLEAMQDSGEITYMRNAQMRQFSGK